MFDGGLAFALLLFVLRFSSMALLVERDRVLFVAIVSVGFIKIRKPDIKRIIEMSVRNSGSPIRWPVESE